MILDRIDFLISKHKTSEHDYAVKIDAAKRTPGNDGAVRQLFAQRELARAQVIEAINAEGQKQLSLSRDRYATFA